MIQRRAPVDRSIFPLGWGLLAVLPTLGILLILLSGCLGAWRDSPPRDVILLSVDTLRWDALGIAGASRADTPVIDDLAEEGTYFPNAFAPMPRTTPALGSLLTGLWPSGHGSREVGDPIRTEATTLAEILKSRGFTTLAVSANDSASPKQRLDQGFDRFVSYRDLVERQGGDLYRYPDSAETDQPGWATVTTRAALELIREESGSERLFLWVFYFDPHFVYRPPVPWQERSPAEKCHRLYDYYEQNRNELGRLYADVGGVASEALDHCRELYRAEVAYTDAEIGNLLDGLADAGRLRDALVVFTADHGENLGEWGLYFEHGDNVHDAALRIPLIFSGPGIAEGRRDRTAVSLVDVPPTVLSLLDVDASLHVDGTDLSSRLDPGTRPPVDPGRMVFAESGTPMWNEATEHVTTGREWGRICINGPRYTLCENPRKAPGELLLYDHVEDPALTRNLADEKPEVVDELRRSWASWPPESARQRTVRTARFKLVEFPRLDGTYESKLFDLRDDPGETRDVKERYPEIHDRLQRALEAWASNLPAPRDRPYDPELEESLRALGYLK